LAVARGCLTDLAQERAMRNGYSAGPTWRNLPLEAKAHVAVQKWLDENAMALLP
jgi:hypothetical protein